MSIPFLPSNIEGFENWHFLGKKGPTTQKIKNRHKAGEISADHKILEMTKLRSRKSFDMMRCSFRPLIQNIGVAIWKFLLKIWPLCNRTH